MDILSSTRLAFGGSSTFTPLPAGEFSKPIQVKPDKVFANQFHYLEDGDGGVLSIVNLTDLSAINNVNGEPTGVPSNDGMWIANNDYLKSSWYNIQYNRAVFDLENFYNIDYAYIWIGDTTRGPITVLGSADGADYNVLMPESDEIEREKWVKLDFTGSEFRGGVRFITLGTESMDAWIKAFVIYGRPQTEVLNQGLKYKRRVVERPVQYHMGTNGFWLEHPELMAPVSGTHRFYVVPQWFYGNKLVNSGSGKNLTPYQIEYRWTNADLGNIDQFLQGFKNYGSKVMIDVNASPAFLRAINTPNAQYSKAVDPGKSSIKLVDTTDPMNYKFIARSSWVWAARYGANKNIDTSQIVLEPMDDGSPQPMRVGLDLVEVLEIGNEFDRWWLGEQMYHNPQEMAAYLSAIYDGHKGAMGPGFGIKNADPSMKVSFISTASGDNIAYANQVMWWCDKYRGKGDYPFDLVNYHWYNSSEGSQDASINAYGLQPELGNLIEANLRWVEFRDTYCPNVEVWLTEVGYDEHYGGVYSPAYPTQFERSRYKAYWLTRVYMINQMTGVDVTNQYWFSNHGSQRVEDSDQYEPHPDKFLTSGLTDGIQDANDWNRKPLMSYWYVANFKHTLTDYKYSHVIMKYGVSQLEGATLIPTVDEHIWAMAYKNELADENTIVLWLDTAEFRTLTIQLKVNEASVQVTNIDEAEIRESLIGVTSTVNAVNGYITLTISECPIFVKTSNIGKPMLKPVENIAKQEVGDNGSVLLTWTDKNIVDTEVIISRSSTLNGTYTTIYSGPLLAECQYIDESAQASINYFYKIVPVYPGNAPVIITPAAPTLIANDTTNTLTATQTSYPSDIVYSTDGGTTYLPYTTTINVGNINRAAGYYRFKVKAGTNRNESSVVLSPAFNETTVEDPNFDILNAEELLMDSVYYAKNSQKFGTTTAAVSGDSVGTVLDKKGSYPLFFQGDTTPAVIGVPPILTENYITAENVPDLQYHSADFAVKHFPYECTWVMRSLPGQTYEAWSNSFQSNDYVGNVGDGVRVLRNNFTVPNAVTPPHFVKTIVHVQFDTNFCRLWIKTGTNGDGYQGQISHSETQGKIGHALFVDTNNANWDFFAQYQKLGRFTSDAVRLNYLNSLATKWQIDGTEVKKPFAYDVFQTFNNTTQTWTANFSTKNPSGGGINLAQTKYKWYLNKRDAGGFGDQTLVGTGATLPRSAYSALLAGYTGNVYIICYVMAVDSAGNGWKYTVGGYSEE